MSDSMKKAFLKTKGGKQMYLEAKQRKVEIADRIRQLKSLVHDTFVVHVPEGFNKRWDVYQRSKDTVKQLGINGGDAYNQALVAVKFAWTSRRNYKRAMEAIGC